MYEFKHPLAKAATPQANAPAAVDVQQAQAVVQQVDGQDVVVLKFCRCGDCRRYQTCSIASDQPDHWLYCAMYRGPLLNDEYVSVPAAPRHVAAVGQQTPPVGTRADMIAAGEHVAKPTPRSRHGPTVANVARLPKW